MATAEEYKKARLKYKPDRIKVIFVAEAPPDYSKDRYFYFEKVKDKDSLFLEIMKVLYPGFNAKEMRIKKGLLLSKFKDDGYYLIDSVEEPFVMPCSSNSKKKQIEEKRSFLLQRLINLLGSNPEAKVILIAVPVYNALFDFLIKNNIPVINTTKLYFPGSGGQKQFRKELLLLMDHGFRRQSL